ncbi:hypothetical protein FQN52_008532, partial [Onygenales sp. PD_12]
MITITDRELAMNSLNKPYMHLTPKSASASAKFEDNDDADNDMLGNRCEYEVQGYAEFGNTSERSGRI